MVIRLLKATENAAGKKLAIGQVYTVTNKRGKKLIDEKAAELYGGPMPPVKKAKSELFKPKTDK